MIYELLNEFKKQSIYFNLFKDLKCMTFYIFIFLIFILFLPIFYYYSKFYAIIIFISFCIIFELLIFILLLKKYIPKEYHKNFTFDDIQIIKKKDFELFLILVNKYKMKQNLDTIKEFIDKKIKEETNIKKSKFVDYIISILVSIIGPIITYFISNNIRTTLIVLTIIILFISFIYIIKFDLKFIFSKKEDYIYFLNYTDTQLLESKAYFNIHGN